MGSAVLQAEWESEETAKVPVNSSNVKSVGYNPTFKHLFVEFLNGALYCYEKVPDSVFGEFMVSPSKGKFVYDRIRGANGRRGLKQNDVDTVYSCIPVNK